MSLSAREALNKLISNADVQQFAVHAEDWSSCSTGHGTSGQRRLNASRIHASHAARRFRTSESGSAPVDVQNPPKVVAEISLVAVFSSNPMARAIGRF